MNGVIHQPIEEHTVTKSCFPNLAQVTLKTFLHGYKLGSATVQIVRSTAQSYCLFTCFQKRIASHLVYVTINKKQTPLLSHLFCACVFYQGSRNNVPSQFSACSTMCPPTSARYRLHSWPSASSLACRHMETEAFNRFHPEMGFWTTPDVISILLWPSRLL